MLDTDPVADERKLTAQLVPFDGLDPIWPNAITTAKRARIRRQRENALVRDL